VAFCPGAALERGSRWNALSFERPRPVLSSAPVGGGEVAAVRVVNLCVHGPRCRPACDDPAAAFAELAAEQGWAGPLVGLMTGVAADHLGASHRGEWSVLATAGTGNAHRAGEPATAAAGAGTINIVAVTGQALTAAARAEALALAAEAKAALLADLDVRVPGSGRVASGTGTDAVAIVAGHGAETPYTGYHTASGQALVAAVRAAVAASLEMTRGRGDVEKP
jgi:iron complex transport system ATP-binding protein